MCSFSTWFCAFTCPATGVNSFRPCWRWVSSWNRLLSRGGYHYYRLCVRVGCGFSWLRWISHGCFLASCFMLLTSKSIICSSLLFTKPGVGSSFCPSPGSLISGIGVIFRSRYWSVCESSLIWHAFSIL